MRRTPLAAVSLLLPLCLWTACKADKSDTNAVGDTGDTDDTAGPVELVPGCVAADPGQLLSVEIGPTEVLMVPVVRWSSTTASTAYIAYSGEDGVVRTTPVDDSSTDHEITLRGLHGGETVRAMVVLVDGGSESCSDELSIENEKLPASMPSLTFDGTPDDGYVLAPLFTEGAYGILVLDGQGEIVFYLPTDEPVWRARFARDGDTILYNHSAPAWGVSGSISRASWDGSVELVSERTNMHTDFDELPDGSFVTLEWVTRSYVDGEGDDREILGDRAYQVLEDGTDEVIWDVFDNFTPDLSFDYPKGSGTPSETAEDWSHTNGVTYDDERNEVYLSVQVITGIVGIDLDTKEQLWSVSKDHGNLTPSDEATIRNPHSIYRWRDDQYVIFNRNDLGVECSDVTALEFTADDTVAQELWKYPGLDCLSVYYLGEARPLPNDDMLITWTTSGVLQRITPEQESLWTITSALGAAFGFSDWSDTLYPE